MTWNLDNGLTGTTPGLAAAILITIAVGILWGRLLLALMRHRKG